MTEAHGALSTPPPLTQFTKFPELPIELRLKIWGYASRIPRLLELQYCIVDRKFFSFQKLPSILHTSQESRAVGRCYYHLSFGTDKHCPGTYFNSVNDIVYLGSEQYGDEIDYMIRHFDKQSGALGPRDQIQNLALAEYLWQRDYHYGPFAISRGIWSFRNFRRTFPHLKRLIFVKGRKVPFGTEEEPLIGRRNYAGPSLTKSEPDLDLIRNPNLALEAFISSCHAEKQKHPERLYPEVVVMELHYS